MKIALLAEDGFRDEELIFPYYRLKEAGFEPLIATENKKQVTGKYGLPVQSDIGFSELKTEAFAGVIIPGGLNCPDKLRMKEEVLTFVKDLDEQGKLISAICHGVWVLVSARILKNKKATCYKAIKDDVINAGALYFDEEVIVDGNLITSRQPSDLPAFIREIINFLNNL